MIKDDRDKLTEKEDFIFHNTSTNKYTVYTHRPMWQIQWGRLPEKP